MKTVIIIAHGSRRNASNEEFINFVSQIETEHRSSVCTIAHAFLELSEPTLNQAIESAIHQGSTTIDILPYFLNAGVHVERDIPKLMSEAQATYPKCRFTTLPYIGALTGMQSLVASQITTK
ncbi:MAG: CbiX/SirB N-terminal domain-containing protein [Fibrobacterales bacterium]